MMELYIRKKHIIMGTVLRILISHLKKIIYQMAGLLKIMKRLIMAI